MASLKNVKTKIAGVRKTKQITKAMNMVASAKLRMAQTRIERFRPYAEKFRSVLADLASKAEGAAHPLLEARPDGRKWPGQRATSGPTAGTCSLYWPLPTGGCAARSTWP